MPLSAEGQAKITEAFKVAAGDDGKLNLDEFGKMIRNVLGASEKDFPAKKIVEMFQGWQDVNDKTGGDDELTLDEVLAAMNKEPASKDALIAKFKEWDSDGSGSISVKELTDVYMTLGHSEAAAKKAIASCDADNDGQINLEEFIKFMEES